MAVVSAHSGHIWLIACDARDRAIERVKNDPDHPPSDAIVAIILSAAATEAFINELAEVIAMTRVRLDETLSTEVRAFADAIREIEESHGSLQDKYLTAAQTLRGSPFDKGTNPFQDFDTLVKLRNDLMHAKPKDGLEIDANGALSTAVPKHITALQQRRLARTPCQGVNISWFDTLTTEKMATWAPKTAHAIILAVLDLIPDGPFDPALMFKYVFRNRTP